MVCVAPCIAYVYITLSHSTPRFPSFKPFQPHTQYHVHNIYNEYWNLHSSHEIRRQENTNTIISRACHSTLSSTFVLNGHLRKLVVGHRVAKTHRIPYLHRSFSAKSDLYLVALLWKMICNLGDPTSLRQPVLPHPFFAHFFFGVFVLSWSICSELAGCIWYAFEHTGR